jgi:hypothetical protein
MKSSIEDWRSDTDACLVDTFIKIATETAAWFGIGDSVKIWWLFQKC